MVDKKDEQIEDVVEEAKPIEKSKEVKKPIGYEVALYTNASAVSKALDVAVIEWRLGTDKIEISSIQTGQEAEILEFLKRGIVIDGVEKEVYATEDPEKWIINLSNVSAGALWKNWIASEAKEIN